LVFVTSTKIDATSTDISDYNAHVQAAAEAAGIGTGATISLGGTTWTVDITWTAIGSTSADDAKDNAPVTADVYNMGGFLVDSSASFYNSVTLPQNSVSYDENGNDLGNNLVWTGTLMNGLKDTPRYLGGTDPAGVRSGNSQSSGSGWITDGIKTPNTLTQSLYALSQPLSVVPEPSTLAIWSLLGGLGIAVAWRRRRKAA